MNVARHLPMKVVVQSSSLLFTVLSILFHVPITRVKLDRLLVAAVDSNSRSAAIVRSIVALCHGLGLQVVAEGVERTTQLEFLSHCGPIGVQGFLLAHPVEADAVPAEAQSAAARARLTIEAALQQPRRDAAESLVFVGGSARRRIP